MDYCLWESISCKYILKKIFAYLKASNALKIIKKNKKIKSVLEISLFHYQYYYCFILFKSVTIESIDDILYSYYLQIFPENVRYDLALNLIKNRKLFKDEYVYLNIDDKIGKDFVQKIKEKKIINDFNYIIGNIEQKKYDESTKKNYSDNISRIMSMDIIDKILFDFNFFTSPNYSKNIQHLYINISPGEIYNISLFDNLKYLSIIFDSERIKAIDINKAIKIIITEKQIQNLKILKIIESKKVIYTIKNIIFETENNNDKKFFKNLKELHISKELLNKIKFDSMKLQKLNLIYDFRDEVYSIDFLKDSFNDLLEKYLHLTNLNITFYYPESYDYSINEFIQDIFFIFFDKIQNIENYSLNFWSLYYNDYYGVHREECILSIKNLPNKKIILKGNGIPIDIFQNHFKEIEKIDLSLRNWNGKCNFYFEENSSISSLKKISIRRGTKDTLYLPIKSFSSLNFLDLDIYEIYFFNEFPLFSIDSSIKFNNLEYISLNTETIDVITSLINNFSNTPNLRFLSIISNYIYSTTFPYYRDIIHKIVQLKKLHTLIIGDNGAKPNLWLVSHYYSTFPELKNTNVKFCFLLCK